MHRKRGYFSTVLQLVKSFVGTPVTGVPHAGHPKVGDFPTSLLMDEDALGGVAVPSHVILGALQLRAKELDSVGRGMTVVYCMDCRCDSRILKILRFAQDDRQQALNLLHSLN